MTAINLHTISLEDVKAMTPVQLAQAFDAKFIGLYTNPTPSEWIGGAAGQITGDNMLDSILQARRERDNFILYGTTNQGKWKIFLPCIEGKLVRPSEFTVEQYKPFLSNSDFDTMGKYVAEYNGQTDLTNLLKPVFSRDLVGQHALYQVNAEPKSKAYPKGNEVHYLDDYIAQLDHMYSFHDLFGQKADAMKSGSLNAIAPIVMGSPLQNSEAEDILAYMLVNSAHASRWQPFIIDVPHLTDTSLKTAAAYLDSVRKVDPNYNRGMIEAGILFGIAKASRGDFAIPTEFENKVVVLPSQTFVEYCVGKQQK